jgi:glutamine synthetase
MLRGAELGELAGDAADLVAEFDGAIAELEAANLADNQPHDDVLEHATYMHGQVIPAMDRVRAIADRMERIVADDLWPLPKYSEILFIK